MNTSKSKRTQAAALTAMLLAATVSLAPAGEPKGYLETVRRHITLASTVAENGDLNPYALVVAPVSAGKIQKGDVLVDNFNRVSNLQGTGTTIMDYNPVTKKMTMFAKLPSTIPGCPGGVGNGKSRRAESSHPMHRHSER